MILAQRLGEQRLVAARPKSQAKYEGRVSPTAAAAAANSAVADATPWYPAGMCGIQKLRFSSGNAIGPSHHLWAIAGMRVASQTPGVALWGEQTGCVCVFVCEMSRNVRVRFTLH